MEAIKENLLIVGEEQLDREYVKDLKEWSAENDKKREKERKEKKANKTISPIDAYHTIKDYKERKNKTTVFISAEDYKRVFGGRGCQLESSSAKIAVRSSIS